MPDLNAAPSRALMHGRGLPAAWASSVDYEAGNEERQRYIDTMTRAKVYDPSEAMMIVRDTARAKSDETIELRSSWGVDPRHADQQVRGVVILPSRTGHTKRVLS